jgi:hypothetical protein
MAKNKKRNNGGIPAGSILDGGGGYGALLGMFSQIGFGKN